jgi:hypothetical protein
LCLLFELGLLASRLMSRRGVLSTKSPLNI